MGNRVLTRGQLAKQTGLGIEAIRFYEKNGILESPDRTRAGYRIYDDTAIRRINFVRRAQALGFTLKEIRELILMEANPDAECGDLREHAQEKLRIVEGKIAELERMRTALSDLLVSCHQGQPLRDCPVMRCFSEVC